MSRENSPLELAILEAFTRNPEQWLSLADLFVLIYPAENGETHTLPVPGSKTRFIRHALLRLSKRGLAFNLGRLLPDEASTRPVSMWGPAEAVIAQARMVEHQIGAQWVDKDLLAAATSALSKREAQNLTGGA